LFFFAKNQIYKSGTYLGGGGRGDGTDFEKEKLITKLESRFCHGGAREFETNPFRNGSGIWYRVSRPTRPARNDVS